MADHFAFCALACLYSYQSWVESKGAGPLQPAAEPDPRPSFGCFWCWNNLTGMGLDYEF